MSEIANEGEQGMHRKQGAFFVLFLGLGALVAAPAQASWTELKASPNGHFVARAYINAAPTTAIIDTGATVVVIPYEEAARMRLHPGQLRFNRPVWTANGKAMAAVTRLRRVEIDGVVARDVEALVMPKGALRHVLIGMSFLRKLRRYVVNANTMRLVD